MNSSESEGDFESADEDLNDDDDCKSQEENDCAKTSTNNDHIDVEASNKNEKIACETISSVKIDDKCGNLDLNEEPFRSDTRETVPKNEDDTEKASKSIICQTLTTSEGEKTVPEVRKLDTKLSDKSSDFQQEEDSTLSEKENNKRSNSQEKKNKPLKLGTKLLPKENKTQGNNDSDSNTIKNVNIKENISISEDENVKSSQKFNLPDEKSLGTNDGWEIEEDGCISTSEELNIVKSSQEVHLADETNLETGDGWELEEEDGFEIPATLTSKKGDIGIEYTPEQIVGSDQNAPRDLKAEEQSWGGWGGWGVSSLLSTASGTVTSFSSQVTAGLSTVIETTVGAPDPASLARDQLSQRDEQGEPARSEDGYGGLGSIMSGVSFLGSSVINRGLDTLETIGKKTMEVLQEGDPGLKKKRALLFQDEDKPILSQILREAKERADNSDKEKEEKEAARKVHYESLFDDFQGMVHLEALEMLSTQSELKLQSLMQSYSGPQLKDLEETLSQVRDLCELTEEDEETEALTAQQFADSISECFLGLKIKMTPAKIIKVNEEICTRLQQQQSATVVNETAILSLAELTAAAMECFHKSAELVMAKSIHNTADEADSYLQLTKHMCARVSAVANDFTQLLTKNDPIANSSLITNIFLEASNSCSYIKNACQLLVPILQVGAVAS
ncbi:protein FAM114A2 [Macrosteles quadrilineatus]|uniref:protein FAM114A2 n=1 Tax=Macrosteles quadrilineatus TaxID=74068 RepID=UPI0023E3351E|nr:protein FAM114A2 [Macrosteles quadrilineatus]